MISTMRDLTIGVLERLDITSIIYIDLSIKYTERILRGLALNKFLQVLTDCKELAKLLAGYQWSFRSAKLVRLGHL